MPLEELTDLGYEVWRSEENAPFVSMVQGKGQSWALPVDADEEELVTTVKNHAALYDKMTQAATALADNYRNWGTLTAQQKDAANRQAQRALANLIRMQRNDLSSAGD